MNKFLLTSLLSVGMVCASDGKADGADVSAEAVQQLRERLAALSESTGSEAPATNKSRLLTLDITEDEFEQRLAEGKKKALKRRDSVSNFRDLEEKIGALPEQPEQPGDATKLLREMQEELEQQLDILSGLHKNGTIPHDIWTEVFPANLVSQLRPTLVDSILRDQRRINKLVVLCMSEGIDLRPHLQMTCKKADAPVVAAMSETPAADGGPAASQDGE